MKNITSLFLLAFLSTLAFANPSTPARSITQEANEESQEVIITPVGFDHVLTMMVWGLENPVLDLELSYSTGGTAYKTTVKISESGIVEMDLNEFERGTYTLQIVSGDFTEKHTLILP